MSNTTYQVGTMGNGKALHLIDAQGVLCNRWGTVNGVWKSPKVVEGADWTDATCKKCAKLRQAVAVAR